MPAAHVRVIYNMNRNCVTTWFVPSMAVIVLKSIEPARIVSTSYNCPEIKEAWKHELYKGYSEVEIWYHVV